MFAYAIPSTETDESRVVVLIFGITTGLFTIIYYYKFGKKCPNCSYNNMPSLDEPEGQEIIKEHGLAIEDTATDICTECRHQGIRQQKHSLVFSILLVPFGLIVSLLSLFMNAPIGFLGSLIIIGTGIFGIVSNIFTNNKCPSCKKKSYIPMDSPEAQALIKD